MLTGKVALITGGSRGIGREIALTLASYGASVIVNYQGAKEKAEEVVALIQEQGGTASAMQCNIGSFLDTKVMVEEALAAYGKIDILVNNAGITRDNLAIKMTEEDFDQVIETNLKGTFNMIKHLYRPFIKQRAGRIINITSVVGILGNAGQANYSASKAGVIGLTKSFARELAARNITVNAVAPGFIKTEMTEAMSESVIEASISQIPLKRAGEVKEVAEMVAFLASDKASYMTGQIISVDGGMNI